MFRYSRCARGLFAKLLTPLLAWTALAGTAAAEDPPGKLRVGISNSLYRHVPERLFKTTFSSVEALIQEQTGLAGHLLLGGASEQLLGRLADGQVDLAVLSGMEFAWARQKNAKLKPLVIAVNQQKYLRVHILVRQDCAATRLSDLKDRPVALPRASMPHCELFLKRQGCLCGTEMAPAFSQLCRPADAEDALDDVVEGKAQAAVIDGAVLDCYRRRKLGRFAQLKELDKPESFPVPIVAYVDGRLDEADLRAFREGIVKVQQTAKGRQVLTLWKLTGFEPVPDDYAQLLDDVAKTYTAPSVQK